jgi:hypothetical protein
MLSLAPLTGNSRAHFDFSRDYLLFGCGCNSRYWDCNCRDMVGHTARLRISRVLYWVPATWDYQLRYVHLSFKHVKEILVFEPPTPLPAHLKKNPEIKFEHLRETKKPFQWQEQGKDLYETFLSQTFLPRPPFAPYTPFSLDETYDPENAEEEQEKWSGYPKKIARVELGTTLEIMKTYYGTTNISYRLR